MTGQERGICIFGLDGSGKTTLAKMLRYWFLKRGVDAVYARPKFGQRLWTRGSENAVPFSSVVSNNGFRRTSGVKKGLLLSLLLIEHYVAVLLQVVGPALRGRTVLVERYWPDTMVDLVVDFDITYTNARLLTEPLRRTFNGKYIILKISPRAAFLRKSGPYTEEYLSRREIVYTMIAGQIGAEEITTEHDINHTFDRVRSIIERSQERSQ